MHPHHGLFDVLWGVFLNLGHVFDSFTGVGEIMDGVGVDLDEQVSGQA